MQALRSRSGNAKLRLVVEEPLSREDELIEKPDSIAIGEDSASSSAVAGARFFRNK